MLGRGRARPGRRNPAPLRQVPPPSGPEAGTHLGRGAASSATHTQRGSCCGLLSPTRKGKKPFSPSSVDCSILYRRSQRNIWIETGSEDNLKFNIWQRCWTCSLPLTLRIFTLLIRDNLTVRGCPIHPNTWASNLPKQAAPRSALPPADEINCTHQKHSPGLCLPQPPSAGEVVGSL
ncbi:hypothetical protein HJG60_009489 [Phyllostomus discolor]|uniref:Uncharacterized protein n=1 Tax=Phyllostomus discolor TaxID=89673 RepID=A0A833YLE6_9CHIR|nr:hypothetical protein HJG60_009489 [Phyllostomus discolor]